MSARQPSPIVRCWRREWQHVARSRWDQFLLFGFPLILVVVIAWIFTPSVATELPVAVIDHDASPVSRALVRRIDATSSAHVVLSTSDDEAARRLFRRAEAYAIVDIPQNTEREINRGLSAKIYIFFNDSFYSSGNQVRRAVEGAIQSLSGELAGARLTDKRAGQRPVAATSPLNVQAVSLFNPQVSFEQALVSMVHPAVLHLLALCAMIGAICREADDGRMDDWIGDGSVAAALAGKLLPYILVYTAWNLVALAWLSGIRGWTVEGSVWLIALAQWLMYVAYAAFAVLFAGAAGETARALSAGSLFAGPSLAYANTLFPTIGAPMFVQVWTHALPYTAYMRLQNQQWQMGSSIADSLPQIAALLAFPIVLALPCLWLMSRARHKTGVVAT
ncbi:MULTISPECIES: ABC transporter permease [Dyella]|uniref:ABC transporter permease n=2 Tax=Dyella TaxID=231454 RepID=A0A4V2NMD2_9GAMM|nr:MULTISPECIES: ABC transporter permease [Dyella]TBR39540.1 ABC transporter permease [Dyella terrae]TCI12877.1 ABC transporter permease [Dyella soli]